MWVHAPSFLCLSRVGLVDRPALLGTDFLEGFLVDHPRRCRTLEDTESHQWIQNGITVNPNEAEKGVDFAHVIDLHAEPESGETQVEFDDEY